MTFLWWIHAHYSWWLSCILNMLGKCFPGLAAPSFCCGLRQGWLACRSLISPSCLSWTQGWHFPSSSPEALLPVIIFLSTPGCIPSRPMELWISSLNKHCWSDSLSQRVCIPFSNLSPQSLGPMIPQGWLLKNRLEQRRNSVLQPFPVPAGSLFQAAVGLHFLLSSFSDVCTYRSPCCLWYLCLIRFHFGFNFSNCISACSYSVAVFLLGYLSLIPFSILHLLYSSFLHLSSAWSSLFIHASYLAFLPDFLLIGMDGSCVWRRWYLNTKQLLFGPSSQI